MMSEGGVSAWGSGGVLRAGGVTRGRGCPEGVGVRRDGVTMGGHKGWCHKGGCQKRGGGVRRGSGAVKRGGGGVTRGRGGVQKGGCQKGESQGGVSQGVGLRRGLGGSVTRLVSQWGWCHKGWVSQWEGVTMVCVCVTRAGGVTRAGAPRAGGVTRG